MGYMGWICSNGASDAIWAYEVAEDIELYVVTGEIDCIGTIEFICGSMYLTDDIAVWYGFRIVCTCSSGPTDGIQYAVIGCAYDSLDALTADWDLKCLPADNWAHEIIGYTCGADPNGDKCETWLIACTAATESSILSSKIKTNDKKT